MQIRRGGAGGSEVGREKRLEWRSEEGMFVSGGFITSTRRFEKLKISQSLRRPRSLRLNSEWCHFHPEKVRMPSVKVC